MFDVKHKYKEEIYKVYGSRTTESTYQNASAVDFLIYFNNEWRWFNAENLVPLINE